jgi:hypothetical protein
MSRRWFDIWLYRNSLNFRPTFFPTVRSVIIYKYKWYKIYKIVWHRREIPLFIKHLYFNTSNATSFKIQFMSIVNTNNDWYTTESVVLWWQQTFSRITSIVLDNVTISLYMTPRRKWQLSLKHLSFLIKANCTSYGKLEIHIFCCNDRPYRGEKCRPKV